MSIKIKDNGDGTGDIKQGNTVVARVTVDGKFVPVRRSSDFPIVSGAVPIAIPDWATKVTLGFRGVTSAAAATLILQGYDSGVLVTSGYETTVGYILNASSSSTYGGLSANGAALTPANGFSNTVGARGIIELVKMGSVWQLRCQGMTTAFTALTSYATIPIANLTAIRLATDGPNLTAGTYHAAFE